ncbi:putative ABC transporter domain-containing protein [Seiridium cardinale]
MDVIKDDLDDARFHIAVVQCCFYVVFLALFLVRYLELQQHHSLEAISSASRSKRFMAILMVIFAFTDIVITLKTTQNNLRTLVQKTLQLFTIVALVSLSRIEHRKSISPSDVITGYLVLSSIFWLLLLTMPHSITKAPDSLPDYFMVAQAGNHVILLCLELRGKFSLEELARNGISPEDASGIIRKTLFLWVNDIMAAASRTVLTIKHLPHLDKSLKSGNVEADVSRAWKTQGHGPACSQPLMSVLLRALRALLIDTVKPRIFLVVFRFAQPILIRQVIHFVAGTYSGNGLRSRGYWILATSVFLYTGLTFSNTIYEYRLTRLRMMTRAALVSLIYGHITDGDVGVDAGSAVTLMSNDCDAISNTGWMLNDLWAYTLEAVMGFILLSSEVGKLAWLPIFIALPSAILTIYIADRTRTKQKQWSAATQNRLQLLTATLQHMRNVKAVGQSEALLHSIEKSRIYELKQARMLRWMLLSSNAVASSVSIFIPALTLGLFAWGNYDNLNSEKFFGLAVTLGLFARAMGALVAILPQLGTCVASYERIQTYLVGQANSEPISRFQDSSYLDWKKSAALRFQGSYITSSDTHLALLHNCNFEIARSEILLCVGPVGCGKSLLAKAVLGEISLPIGTVITSSTRIGYCSQTPWIPDGTIRQVITGFESGVDTERYKEAISLSCLQCDISNFDEEDRKMVGTNGMNLSGGQKQRLAIARLIYSSYDLAILDDSFSALDRATHDSITRNLFAQEGFFRRKHIAVLWISSSVHSTYVNYADQVLTMGKTTQENLNYSTLLGPDSSNAQSTGTGKVMEKTPVVSSGKGTPQSEKLQQATDDAAKDLGRRSGDFNLYKFYFENAGYRNAMAVFSQDIQVIDTALPGAVVLLSTHIFKLFLQTVLILNLQRRILLAILPCLVVVYFVSKFFLQASRQLRLLEMETRSALFSSFIETVKGVTTIRAFGWQDKMKARNLDRLEDSQRVLYVLLCIKRWLNLILGLTEAGVAVAVVSFAVKQRATLSPGEIGVMLNMVLETSTALRQAVDSWANMEIFLGAVDRLRQIQFHTPNEDTPYYDNIPPADWPSQGKVRISNLVPYYNHNSKIGTKGLDLVVEPGEKLTICGRTGSGKSTLFHALLGLVDYSGKIEVDGLDLARVPRTFLRQNCFVTIPQESLSVMSESLHFNIDPSNIAPAWILVDALKKTQLWEHLTSKMTSSISGTLCIEEVLEMPLQQLPPLSNGQAQLLSIARALVMINARQHGGVAERRRPSKSIVLLDEATSSLDQETDALVQDVIEKEIISMGHTVLLISHRVVKSANTLRLGNSTTTIT